MTSLDKPFAFNKDDCSWYTPFYCEENIYRLGCALKQLEPSANFEIVFISNKHKKIPLWAQKNGSSDDSMPVIWDYHVILFQSTESAVTCVYDLDTVLPFPVSCSEYMLKALKPSIIKTLPKQYHRLFRVIPGHSFLTHFASDRSHMFKDNVWMAEPPKTSCIATQDSIMNLPEYFNMTTNTNHPVFGKVLTESELIARYS
ncbi:hypothetical protein MT418_002992 [Batrachochytrium dendrobatidis]